MGAYRLNKNTHAQIFLLYNLVQLPLLGENCFLVYFVAVFMVLKCQPEGDCTGRRCCVWLGWLLQDALCISVVVGAEGLFQGGKRAASDLPGDGEDPPGALLCATALMVNHTQRQYFRTLSAEQH